MITVADPYEGVQGALDRAARSEDDPPTLLTVGVAVMERFHALVKSITPHVDPVTVTTMCGVPVELDERLPVDRWEIWSGCFLIGEGSWPGEQGHNDRRIRATMVG